MRVTGLFICAIAATVAAACTADDTGIVHLSLTGQAASGTRYRLRDAELIVSGGAAPRVLRTEDDPDRTSIRTQLAPGSYTLAVAEGWYLDRRRDDGSFERVTAALTTANPTAFSIAAGDVTRLGLRFLAGTDVVELDDGSLDIEIGIDELDAALPDAALPDAFIADAGVADASAPDALPGTGATLATGDDMAPGEVLLPGTSLSNQGIGEPYTLRLRGDGIVDVVRTFSVWSWPMPGTVLIMQIDGNLVLYRSDGSPVWATATDGHPGARVRVDGTGVKVLLGTQVLWSRP